MSNKDDSLARGKRMSFVLIVTLLAALAAVSPASAAQSPQIPLAGSAIPQFAQKLPGLDLGAVVGTDPAGVGIKVYVGAGAHEIHICEFDANVLPPSMGFKTRSWGYIVGSACPVSPAAEYTQDSYIGPVLVNVRNVPSTLTFINDLGKAAKTRLIVFNDVEGESKTALNPVTGVNPTRHDGGRLQILANSTKWSGESLRARSLSGQ